jgi:hypothetical protein
MLDGMIVGRLIGWLFLLAGLGILARDLMNAAASRVWDPIALGQLWQQASPGSMSALESAIQRGMGIYAWRIADSMLTVWAFAALLLIGLGLLIAFHRRRDVIQ